MTFDARGLFAPPVNPDNLDEALMRDLWENHREVSASEIAEQFGVTKNVVIGRAHRREWVKRGASSPPSPFEKRIAKLDIFPSSISGCVYPIGNPGEAKFHFCAKTRSPENSYCETHHRKTSLKPREMPDAAD